MKAKTLKERFTLAPRHAWFANISRDAEDGWVGPYRTVGEAVLGAEEWWGDSHESVFVAQGRKIKKQEREEWEVEFQYLVETPFAFEVVISPTKREGE